MRVLFAAGSSPPPAQTVEWFSIHSTKSRPRPASCRVLALVVDEGPVGRARPDRLLRADLGQRGGGPLVLRRAVLLVCQMPFQLKAFLPAMRALMLPSCAHVRGAVALLDQVDHPGEGVDAGLRVEGGLGDVLVEEVAAVLPEQRLELEGAGEDVAVDPLALDARCPSASARSARYVRLVGRDVGRADAGLLQHVLFTYRPRGVTLHGMPYCAPW